MKKFSALMLILLLLITGCSTAVAPEPAAPAEPPPAPETPAAPDPRPIPPVTEDGIVEIEEDWFIAQTLTIQDNLDDYLGKTIRYEGFVFPFMDPNSKEEVINILRYGPGCWEDDLYFGFEVKWDQPYPEKMEWVEVVGVLEQYQVGDYKFVRIALESLTVLEERGLEQVFQ